MDPIAKKMHIEMVYLFMQFLKEEGQMTVLRLLEENSAIFFNMDTFRNLICEGNWHGAEKYISAFTSMENHESIQIYFEIRNHKCLEAIFKRELTKASDILDNELNVFEAQEHQQICSDLRKVLRMRNIRNLEMFAGYNDIRTIRASVFESIKSLIISNPELRRKLDFPDMENSRLQKVIQQGLCWQHSLCKNPSETPEISSLFIDHKCDKEDAAQDLSQVLHPPSVIIPNADGFQQIDANNIPIESPSLSRATSERVIPISPGENEVRVLKRRLQEEIDSSQHDVNARQEVISTDELPLSVVTSFNSNSNITTMEFHPVRHQLLMIGSDTGDLALWDVCSNKTLLRQSYKNWQGNFTSKLQGPSIGGTERVESLAVKAMKWNSEGTNFAVGYLRNLVRIFGYFGGTELNGYQEIYAHAGSVNDIAFTTTRDGNFWVITCGDDMTVKVWDTFSGELMLCFEGHEAPVISISPRKLDLYEALVSADSDGVVKIWYYDTTSKSVNSKGTLLTAPHQVASKVSYSADGTRLFLGGSTSENVSCIVEINQVDGSIVHMYNGLVTPSLGFLHYEIVNGRYLAAVDDRLFKFWDVNSEEVLKMTTAGGGLPASSSIKSNKEGTLLALMTNATNIRILANADGRRILGAIGKRPVESANAAASDKEVVCTSKAPMKQKNKDKIGECSLPDEDTGMEDDLMGLLEKCSLKEINEVSQCQCRRLPNKFAKRSVCSLAYTKRGRALLDLGSNGEHRLWQWRKDAQNADGMATTHSAPKLWKSPDNEVMVNDVGPANPEGNISCFALPRSSRCFLVSSSGGMVYIYNTMNFKEIANFIPPPGAAVTSLAIHPMDSNIIVMGMDDGSIRIYDYRTRQVLTTLQAHTLRVTGLAFSDIFDALITSGADSQICMWSIDEWKMLGSTSINDTPGESSDTRVEFHKDQIHFLVVDKSQIAIYRAPELIPLGRWVVPEDISSSFISHAVYSSDHLSIFVGFGDGSAGVITASTLELRCKINPTAYIPRNIKSKPYPVVVAAHPSEANQFAMGLSDGLVVVLEPLEENPIWGNLPEDDDDYVNVIDDDSFDAGEGTSQRDIDLDQLHWVDSD